MIGIFIFYFSLRKKIFLLKLYFYNFFTDVLLSYFFYKNYILLNSKKQFEYTFILFMYILFKNMFVYVVFFNVLPIVVFRLIFPLFNLVSFTKRPSCVRWCISIVGILLAQSRRWVHVKSFFHSKQLLPVTVQEQSYIIWYKTLNVKFQKSLNVFLVTVNRNFFKAVLFSLFSR